MLPKGMPVSVRDRLNAALTAAFADPEVREWLRKAQFVPATAPVGPAQFGAFLRAEVDQWAKVVREATITPE